MSEPGPNAGKNEPAGRDPWLKVLLEAVSDPAMVFTPEGKLRDANRAAVEVMEAASLEEMRGRPLEDFIAVEDHGVAAEAKKLLASGGRGEFQWSTAGKKGGRRKVRFRMERLPEFRGKAGGSIIIGREIARRSGSALLTALVAASGDAILSLDLEGRITGWNPAAQQLFGFTPQEAIGKPAPDLLCPAHLRQQAVETLQKLARGKGPFYYESQRQKKDGSLIDVSVTSLSVRNQADELIGIAAIYRDLSDYKQVQAELAIRLEQETALAAFGQRALAVEELAPLLDEAVAQVAKTLNVQYCKVLELQPGGKTLLLRAGVGWKDGMVGQATVGTGRDSQAGYTLLSKEPIIVDDLGTESRFRGPQLLHDHDVVSGLSTIIGDLDQPYGVLGAHTRSRRKFTRDDASFLQGIANIIAQAVKRLATEQALRRSETYFHSLIDNSFDVVVVLDPDATIRLESGSMHRTFGYGPGEVLNRCYFDFVHPDDVEPVRRALDATLESGRSAFECRLRRKDGAWLTCEMASTAVLTPQGRQVLVFSVRDVTERTKAQEEQAFLGSIVESAHIAIIGVTRDGKVASWNRAAASAYGYTAEEILGQPFGTLLVSGETTADEMIERVMGGERFGLHEALRRRKDGQIVSLSVTESPILDKTGAAVGLASIERSPSEETRLQQELQEAHAYTRGLIESSLDAMLMVDADLIITDVNEQAAKLTATRRDAMIGSRFDSYFTDPGHAAQAIRRTLGEGYLTNYELALKPADGEQILVSFNTSVFRDAAGQPSGVFAVARDVTQQRELERDLRQAHAYTSGLIESSLDAMLTVDRNLVILDVNEQMAKMTELPKAMLIGNRFDKCFTDPERAAAGVEQTLEQGFVTNYDLAIHTATAREILVSFNASTFYDTLGNIQGVFVVARDVTEERRNERRLRDQRNYSRALIESSLDALMASDAHLNITDVNEKTVQMTGSSREELLRSPLPSLFADTELAAEAARKALGELVKDYELIIRTADGSAVPVSFSASPFKDAQGKAQGIFASARDIGDRQRLERERSLLASIVTCSEDAIYSETTDGIISSWNGGAEKLFGYCAQEMVGRNLTVCIPLEHRVESREHLRRVLRKEGIQQFETVRRRKDGGLVDVSITMSPMLDKAGEVSGVALIARDITHGKHIEDELTKARDEALEGARLKSEFLANMSHEIRTPLNSLVGLGRMLMDTELDREQQALAREMRESTDGLLAIINDILDFSKMSAGKLLFEEVDFELESVTAAAFSLVAERARTKGLEVAVSIEPDTPKMLRGDPGRLRQVLANLLSNAVKCTERGEIVIRASKVSESPGQAVLRFEVRDTGIGIPEEAHGQLFRAFTQVGDRPQEGTGLGLAIARTLVEQMGGSIGVLSTPGTGSTFWFTAKFTKSRGGVAPRTAARGRTLEGLSALVVDDNETSRGILKSQLVSWKMAVDAMPGAEQAMATLRARARAGRLYSIALLDAEMPGVSGLELARMIRDTPETAHTTLILLSSASRRAQDKTSIAALNITACLEKPVKASELYDALVDALSAKLGLPPEGNAGLAAPEVPEEVAALEIAGAPGRKPHVLLGEDNAGNRKVALWQLDKLGCVVDVATNGIEVLEALARDSYDVVLMDCRMPRMDGYEATRQIRWREGSARHTRIVAMTAHALAQDQKKCIEAGMDDYLSKPVTLESLAATLRRVLGGEPGASSPAPGIAEPAAAGNADVAQAPVLDPATMASLRAKGDLLPGLIDTVVAEMPEQLKQLADALGRRAYSDAAIAAHGLKGTAKIFGAVRMAELAGGAEQAADAEANEKAVAQLERLTEECERVSHELKSERARPPVDIH